MEFNVWLEVMFYMPLGLGLIFILPSAYMLLFSYIADHYIRSEYVILKHTLTIVLGLACGFLSYIPVMYGIYLLTN